ncbi:hypothetical protein EYF80_035270 [Liparis tanakae]|uniref:Uncharacterized protein n=1 Tax=Liparis tanakae TaxID=230148 RepID=A0A4Z2GMQ8_9TELE|nr:hypothetical protein EYF80_035270 [Liparis tanakae]
MIRTNAGRPHKTLQETRRMDLLHAASSMIGGGGVGGVMLGLSHFPPNGEINAEHGVFCPQSAALARRHSYAHLHPLDGVASAASEGLGRGAASAAWELKPRRLLHDPLDVTT